MSHKIYYVNQLVLRPKRAAEGTPKGLPSGVRQAAAGRSTAGVSRTIVTGFLVLGLLLTGAASTLAQTDPIIIPGPDDALVFGALMATVSGDSLTFEQMDAVGELMALTHEELMTRALAHIDIGQPGRAEIDLTLVQAGADTSPARSYAQLSLLGYAQLLQDRTHHATGSLIYASGSYADLDKPYHPAIPGEAAMKLASAYVNIARGAPESDRDALGRQAALWWARAGADGHLSQLSALGADERLIAAWAYAQVGRIDRATVEIALARTSYRNALRVDRTDPGAHEGLARSYDGTVTGVPASANADSARVHSDAAAQLRACAAPHSE